MVELKGEEDAEGRDDDEFGITWGHSRRVTNGGTDQGTNELILHAGQNRMAVALELLSAAGGRGFCC
jgi:hypothetical protein